MMMNNFNLISLQNSWEGYVFGKQLKPTIIYLHDALGGAFSWKDFPQQLFERFPHQGFVFSRFGHVTSEGTKVFEQKNYLDIEADQLRQFIKYYRIHRPILIGSSDGGSIALLYASRYNDCQALISLAGHYKVEKVTQESVASASVDKLVKNLTKYHYSRARKLVEGWQHIWTFDAFQDWNIRDELTKITCPALVMQGAGDPYATDEHMIEMANYITGNVPSYLIENTGHFPHLEQPETVLTHIIKFLNSLSSCEN